MIYLLSNGKQQIIPYGNPNRREYSILARSIEQLDMQSLFDPFEETFHLPALSIEFRYSQVGMNEIVAQKSINVASSIILAIRYRLATCFWVSICLAPPQGLSGAPGNIIFIFLKVT